MVGAVFDESSTDASQSPEADDDGDDDDDVTADNDDDDGQDDSVVGSAVENESCDENEGEAEVAGDDTVTSGGATTVERWMNMSEIQTLANNYIPVRRCLPVKFFSIIIRQMAAAWEEAIFSSELLEED